MLLTNILIVCYMLDTVPSAFCVLALSIATKSNIVGFHVSSAGKESACKAGDPSSIPGLGGYPGEGRGNSLQDSCLENPHGQRSLAGYSPWGRKESDVTEQLSTAQHNF